MRILPFEFRTRRNSLKSSSWRSRFSSTPIERRRSSEFFLAGMLYMSPSMLRFFFKRLHHADVNEIFRERMRIRLFSLDCVSKCFHFFNIHFFFVYVPFFRIALGNFYHVSLFILYRENPYFVIKPLPLQDAIGAENAKRPKGLARNNVNQHRSAYIVLVRNGGRDGIIGIHI